MNKIRIENILKKASYYEYKCASINKTAALPLLGIVIFNLIVLALPEVSSQINHAMVNTKTTKEAVDKLLEKIGEFESRAGGDPDAKEFLGILKDLKELSRKVVTCFKDLTEGVGEARFKAYQEIDGILYDLGQNAYAARTHLDDFKGGGRKAWEAVENFGLTFGVHNYVRDVQDAIDELNAELTKAAPVISNMKKDIEKIAQQPENQALAESAAKGNATSGAVPSTAAQSAEKGNESKSNMAELGKITL